MNILIQENIEIRYWAKLLILKVKVKFFILFESSGPSRSFKTNKLIQKNQQEKESENPLVTGTISNIHEKKNPDGRNNYCSIV